MTDSNAVVSLENVPLLGSAMAARCAAKLVTIFFLWPQAWNKFNGNHLTEKIKPASNNFHKPSRKNHALFISGIKNNAHFGPFWLLQG